MAQIVESLGPPPPHSPLPPQQLSNIKAHLDLILLALEALAGAGSEAVLAAADTLALGDLMGDRVSLWRLRQASPLRQGQGRKKMDIDEARALVLVCAHLAHTHQPLIRQAVQSLEMTTTQGQLPHRVPQIGDYLDRFTNFYADRMAADSNPTSDRLTPLALKLLIDLLIYSQPGGDRRLWLALLDRTRTSTPTAP